MTELFLDFIADDVALCDGAMGTRLYEKGVFIDRCFDAINLSDPDIVREVHEEYIRAGACVIQTNTFGANPFKLEKHQIAEQCREINRLGAVIAREAVKAGGKTTGRALWTAGSIGPLGIRVEPWGRISLKEARRAFETQAAAILEGDVDLFMLETFGDLSEMEQAIKAVKALCDKPVVAQMTITEDGHSLYGTEAEIFTERLEEWGADVAGLNCSVGPQAMLDTLEKMARHTSLPLSIQPNAGSARSVEGRVFFLSSPDYFAKYAHRFIRAGARLIGGCCGTTPEHIKAMASAVRMKQYSRAERPLTRPSITPRPEVRLIPMEEKSRLGKKIADRECVFSIELTPPKGWDMSRILAKSRAARDAGFDAVNIPDGPRASARVAVMATALRIQKEIGIEPVIHYVCRDRNLLGMQSDLLGAYSLGMPNFLLLTGDPPVMGDYPKSTPVFDVDSIGLTNLAHSLNCGVDLGNRSIGEPTGFLIGVGVNPTAVNVDLELERFYWKVDAGAEYAISQPVFDTAALLSFLERAQEMLQAKGLALIPIVAGVWPLQSLKNAEFLQNEVPGVTIPEAVMERMQAAGCPENEKAAGMAVAREQIAEIQPFVRGFQLSTPFGRIKPAVALREYARGLIAGSGSPPAG